MTDDRDQIDTWLERDINPLMPHQGTLDRIRRTARRRKAAQGAMAVAGFAVVIAAVVVVPQLARSGQAPAAGQTTTPTAQGQTASPSATPSAKPATPKPSRSPSGPPGGTSLLAGGLVPATFRPTSVTFVGTFSGTGKAGIIGAVIGQGSNSSKARKCFTKYCTSLAATANYGKTWYGVSAPLTGPPAAGTGVSQLRFATVQDGWAYGPALYATRDGGATWSQEQTFGQRVVALEAAGGRAFAIFARCASTNADFANGCTSFALYTSTDGSTTWTPAPVATAFRTMQTSAPSSASITIAGSAGYVLGPSGEMLRGDLTGGTWKYAGRAKCAPGGAQANGLPRSAHLAALGSPQATRPTLVLACDGGSVSAPVARIYTSATGLTWAQTNLVHLAGQATALASNSADHLVLATTVGIYYSADHGTTWHQASLAGVVPPGGFTYIGMTNVYDGVAVPADPALGELFVTADGGLTWSPSLISR